MSEIKVVASCPSLTCGSPAACWSTRWLAPSLGPSPSAPRSPSSAPPLPSEPLCTDRHTRTETRRKELQMEVSLRNTQWFWGMGFISCKQTNRYSCATIGPKWWTSWVAKINKAKLLHVRNHLIMYFFPPYLLSDRLVKSSSETWGTAAPVWSAASVSPRSPPEPASAAPGTRPTLHQTSRSSTWKPSRGCVVVKYDLERPCFLPRPPESPPLETKAPGLPADALPLVTPPHGAVWPHPTSRSWPLLPGPRGHPPSWRGSGLPVLEWKVVCLIY